MATKTEICNLAIGHLGIAINIANVDTERSTEALACRTFYEITRDNCLRDFDWGFARQIVALGLVEEDPNNEWRFSYRYPSNCLLFRRVQSGYRILTNTNQIPFAQSSDVAGRLIFSDLEDAIGVFTAKITDTSLYTTDFIMALSYRLAMYIGPQVTGGNAFGSMTDRLAKLYDYHLTSARQNSANEEGRDRVAESEFIRGRDSEFVTGRE
jgi:hypothetical protein